MINQSILVPGHTFNVCVCVCVCVVSVLFYSQIYRYVCCTVLPVQVHVLLIGMLPLVSTISKLDD